MEEAFTHKYLELDHRNNDEFNRHVIYSIAKISAKHALTVKVWKSEWISYMPIPMLRGTRR